jgi:hypothetical protein
MGLKEVTNKVMLVEIVNQLEKAKATTLAHSEITLHQVSATLKEMYPATDTGSMSFFKSQMTSSEGFPFSRPLKTTMIAASKLVYQMASRGCCLLLCKKCK